MNGEKKEDTKDNFGREKTFALCLTGVDRYQIEKDIFQVLSKGMDKDKDSRLPIKSIFKKRGQAMAFLDFIDESQQKAFKDSFYLNMAGKKQQKKTLVIHEVNDVKKLQGKSFKNIGKFYDKK